VLTHTRRGSYRRRSDSSSDWRRRVPVLQDEKVLLRELRLPDADALLQHLSGKQVARHITMPPATAEGFRRFIRWTQLQRRRGRHVCFGVVPAGQTSVVGLLQFWPIDPEFSTAEWGFVIGAGYWGTGIFIDAARLVIDFAFDVVGVTRLEARAVATNVRGNAVLRKLGAKREGTLRQGFRRNGTCTDQIMWSILADDLVERRRKARHTSKAL
jgi:ribosomal-protein-alanine N-acetyltransferase